MSSPSFKIRLFEPGDEEQCLDLFNRVFADDNPDFEPRDMDTWRHIYERNPMGHKTLVGTDLDGNIVANYSSCPVAIQVNGEARVATQVVDSCVDMAWRRSLRKNSLFITIAMEYQREFCDPAKPVFNDYIYGLPNENHYPLGVRLLGYTPVHCPLPRQVRAFDERYSDELMARAPGVTVEDAALADAVDTLGALFEAHADEMPLGNRRTADYLGWRFRDAPGDPYRVALARRDGEVCGGAIYRIGVPWEDEPVSVILDWFGSGTDEPCMAALLARIAAVAWEEQHPRLECWVTPAMPQRDLMRSLGFGEDLTRFNLCMVLFSPAYDIPWVKQNWWLTMGDTDIY